MSKHHNTQAHVPAATLLISLTHLDTDAQEAAARFLLLGAKRLPWFGRAVKYAITEQLAEQRAEAAWIEREAMIDEQRMLISRDAYYTDERHQ